jgi:hypothetical protein
VSKVIKGAVIGAIVGVGLFLAAPLVGVTLAIGGTALTLGSAAALGAVYGGLQGAALQFAKKPNMDLGSALGRLNISVDPQAPGAWVFGETPCATDVVFAEQIGDDVIAYVIAAAAHEIDSFGTLHINDELIGFSGDNATGDWSGALQRITRTGTSTQTAITISGSSQWTSAAQGLGIAHFCLRYNLGGDTNDKLKSGIPTRVTQVVKGSKVYDPRLDSTRGGSGTHRADDQSTWAWSDNWALIVAHYLLGYRQAGKLVYGVGVNPDDIDWAQVIAMANVCDQTVDGIARYRVGGIMPTTQDHAAIIGQLEAAIDGKVSKVGGKYYLWCPHNDLVSSGTINDDVVLRQAGVQFIPAGPIADLFNTARGRFIDPASLYQAVPYPEVTESTAVTEDGRERVMDRDFSIIQDRSIAERVAREMVRRSRFSGSWTLAMGPGGLVYQPFSVVTLNLPETDNQNVLARVIDLQFSPEGVVLLTLREENASIYDTTIPLGAPITQTSPDSFDPTRAYTVQGLAAVAVSAIGSGGSRSDGFRVSWSNPGRFVRTTEIRYKIATDTDYTYLDAPEVTQAIILPVEPATLYDIEAAHISISGVIGPYAAIQQTSGATSRAVSITGRVEYSQSNTWIGDGVTYDPATPTTDATFTFRRLDTVIATRVIRGTLNTITGNVAISQISTDGESTTVSVLNDNSAAVIVSVTHTDSGLQISGQFLVLSDVDVSLVQQELADLQNEVNNLNTVTLPALQSDLNDLDSDLNTLNTITIPDLQNDLSNLDSDLNTLNTVTIPALQNDVSNLDSDLNTLNTVTLPNLQNDLNNILPIDTAKIVDGAVITAKISNDAVTTAQLANAAATEAKIATNAITETKITNNAITSPKINAAAVIAGKIAANAVEAGNIAANAVTAATIAANAVTTDKLNALAVTSAKIDALAITADKIAANAVIAGKIDANAVTATQIATDAVTANKIQANAVTTAKINALAVTAAKIATDAVTANKIQAGAVIAGKIAANAVTANEIAADAVTANKIQAGAVIAGKIGANAVTANEIAAGAVTANKINVANLAAINALTGTLTAQLIRTKDAGGRIEITDPATDATFSVWQGSATTKSLANARFAVQHNGDAVFRGRVSAAQLEGPIMDAIPFDYTASSTTVNSNSSVFATVGGVYLEFPETIDRPRRGIISMCIPIFGIGVTGAFVKVEAQIQNANGTWPSTWTEILSEFSVNTDPNSSPAPIMCGTQSTGVKGFRFRARFRPIVNGQNATANRFSGLFLALPSTTGFSVVAESTGTPEATTPPASPTILEPPNFDTGWPIP